MDNDWYDQPMKSGPSVVGFCLFFLILIIIMPFVGYLFESILLWIF